MCRCICFQSMIKEGVNPIVHSALIYYWVGRKKSECLKNGFKPLLLTSWGTHNSNFIFGPFFGPIVDRFWAQKTKNRPNCFLQNCWSSTAFDSIVIRSFKICNWFICLFNHFHRLPEVFKIHILYLDQFLGQIWAQKTKNMSIFVSKLLIFYCFLLLL